MVEKIVWIFLQFISKLVIAVLGVSLFLEVTGSIEKLRHSSVLSGVFYKIYQLSPEEHLVALQIRPALMFVSLVKNYSREFRYFVDFCILDSKTPFCFIWASSQVNQQSELWEKFSLLITEWSVVVGLEVSTAGAETIQSKDMIDTIEVVA